MDVKPDEETHKRLIRPSELPIYESARQPCHCSSRSIVPSRLELEIGRARLFVMSSLGAVNHTKDRAVQIYETGKAHTLDSVAYVREESNLLARIGVISFGGLTGILIGARGGSFKKLFYGSSGAALVASLCYPTEAGQISKSAYMIAKYYAFSAYNKVEDEIRSRSSKPSGGTPASNKLAEQVSDMSQHASSP